MVNANISVKQGRVAILGFTFKENCPDTRNTRVIDIVRELNEYGIKPMIVDPVADAEEARHEYGLEFDSLENVRDMDAVILAVAHDEFCGFTMDDVHKLFRDVPNNQRVLMDVKGILNRKEYEAAGYRYWRL